MQCMGHCQPCYIYDYTFPKYHTGLGCHISNQLEIIENTKYLQKIYLTPGKGKLKQVDNSSMETHTGPK